MHPWTAQISREALQQRLPQSLRLSEGGRDTYRLEFRRGDAWQPVGEVPRQVTYYSEFEVSPSYATEAIGRALAQQVLPELERTVPHYYEYRRAEQPKAPTFEQLYGFARQPQRTEGGQKAYQPVWEQASWMPQEERQKFLQERAEAEARAAGGGQAVQQAALAALQGLAGVAEARRLAQTAALSQLAQQALRRAAVEQRLSQMWDRYFDRLRQVEAMPPEERVQHQRQLDAYKNYLRVLEWYYLGF
jgi:hypothetical protein